MGYYATSQAIADRWIVDARHAVGRHGVAPHLMTKRDHRLIHRLADGKETIHPGDLSLLAIEMA
jgi:hypothetical protein